MDAAVGRIAQILFAETGHALAIVAFLQKDVIDDEIVDDQLFRRIRSLAAQFPNKSIDSKSLIFLMS